MPDKGSRFKHVIGMNEFSKPIDLCKALVAEALGIIFIMYFGCMSVLNINSPSTPADLLIPTFAFGFVVMVAVQALAHVSGANFNPAVSICFIATGQITLIRGILYIMTQCIGAIIGTALLKAVTPDDAQGAFCTTMLHNSVSPIQGVCVEFMLGFILLFVVYGVIDPNKPECKIPASLTVGFTVAVAVMSSAPSTGASINPARSLGSAVVANSWKHHWIFWLGPCLGGITAALLYTFVFAAPPQGEYFGVTNDYAYQVFQLIVLEMVIFAQAKRLKIRSPHNSRAGSVHPSLATLGLFTQKVVPLTINKMRNERRLKK